MQLVQPLCLLVLWKYSWEKCCHQQPCLCAFTVLTSLTRTERSFCTVSGSPKYRELRTVIEESESESRSAMSDSLRPNSPGLTTGVGSLSSQPRDWTQVSHIAGGFATSWAPQWKPKNTGVGRLFLLQRIFPTHQLNKGLLHCRRILYQLSHKGRPCHYFCYYWDFEKGMSRWYRKLLVSNVEFSIDTHLISNFNRKTCPRYKHLPYFCVVVLQLTPETRLDQTLMWLPVTLLIGSKLPPDPPHWVIVEPHQVQLSKWCKILESSRPFVKEAVSRFPNKKTYW